MVLIDEHDERRLISRALINISIQIEKLNRVYRNLKNKREQLFSMCVDAELRGNREESIMYAEEIVQVRRLAELIQKSLILLEALKVRLETIEIVGSIPPILVPLKDIIQDVRENFPTNLTYINLEVNKMLEDLSVLIPSESIPVPSSSIEASKEAKRILESASRLASEKIKEDFPEVPPSIEMEVYRYIKEKKSSFSLEQCSKDLNIPQEKLMDILKLLEKEGKVKIVSERESEGSAI